MRLVVRQAIVNRNVEFHCFGRFTGSDETPLDEHGNAITDHVLYRV